MGGAWRPAHGGNGMVAETETEPLLYEMRIPPGGYIVRTKTGVAFGGATFIVGRAADQTQPPHWHDGGETLMPWWQHG